MFKCGPRQARGCYSSKYVIDSILQVMLMNFIFKWDTSISRIIAMGWNSSERLVLLNEEGQYRLYNLQGSYEQFSLGSEVAEVGILQARIHEEGIVALVGAEHGSTNGQVGLVEVRGWNGGRPVKFADTGKLQVAA